MLGNIYLRIFLGKIYPKISKFRNPVEEGGGGWSKLFSQPLPKNLRFPYPTPPSRIRRWGKEKEEEKEERWTTSGWGRGGGEEEGGRGEEDGHEDEEEEEEGEHTAVHLRVFVNCINAQLRDAFRTPKIRRLCAMCAENTSTVNISRNGSSNL